MFLNVIMLAGIGGALAPLILHLLSRARYRSIDWGAMMFLETAQAHQQRSTRLKQLLLLVLRMTIIALLAVALARPIVRGSWGGLAQEGRSTAVILLDRSASMGFDENGRTRLEMAKRATLQILSTLKKGDQVCLIPLGGKAAGEPRPTTDLQSVAEEVESLRAASGEADVAAGLIQAANIFDQYERFNRELYLICDQQALGWKDVNDAFSTAWARRMKKAGAAMRFVVVPIGGMDAENIAVDSVDLLSPPAITGQSADIEVRVRNYGVAPRSSIPLTVSADNGKPIGTMTVTVGGGATETVRVPVVFHRAGSRIVSASIATGGFTADDRLEASVDVVRPVDVLIISGDEREEAFRSESNFLRLALAPFSHRPKANPAQVRILTADAWSESDLAAAQVVVLANVPQFSETQAHALEQYVYGGGGLLIAPGNLTRWDNYNIRLYRNGEGIMPARLDAPTAADGSQSTSLVGIDLTHPVFRFLKGRPDPVPSATIGRYFPATPRRPDGRVLASYVSGEPYLIEADAGRGRVFLLTTPVDMDWNTIPWTNFFLPFVQSAVRYLAAGTLADRNLDPGQPIQALFDEAITMADITGPDGRRDDVALFHSGDRAEVRYLDTLQPGRYTLRVKRLRDDADEPQTLLLHYVVRTPRAESDLTPLTGDQWRQLGEKLSFERLDPNQASLPRSIVDARAGRELWMPLLLAVVALAMGETALTRLWRREEE